MMILSPVYKTSLRPMSFMADTSPLIDIVLFIAYVALLSDSKFEKADLVNFEKSKITACPEPFERLISLISETLE